jgi:hypothetical protein
VLISLFGDILKNFGIDEYSLNLERKCKAKNCNRIYTIKEYLDGDNSYFLKPVNYRKGCKNYCMECWLGVPPDDLNIDDRCTSNSTFRNFFEATEIHLSFPDKHEYWYDSNIYKEILIGDLSTAYKNYIYDECHLAILPLSRLHIDMTLLLPYGVTIYPAGVLKLNELNFRNEPECLSALQSKVSGINIKTLNEHPLIVLPFKCEWETIFKCTHDQHLNIIRWLSELVDKLCLNFIRFKNCELEPIPSEDLPSHAGQISTNHMMSSALLFNSKLNEAKLISGAVFSHYITRGLGLVATQPEWDEFPQDGEVANIVNHALLLYANLLETQMGTSRFVQALSLLEYLAYPMSFALFQDVRKIITKYQTSDPIEKERLKHRFIELTGKKDEDKKHVGFRTRIVHIGARIEDIVPKEKERKELFKELDGYIRAVINHMIKYSDLSFDEYVKERDKLDP